MKWNLLLCSGYCYNVFIIIEKGRGGERKKERECGWKSGFVGIHSDRENKREKETIESLLRERSLNFD